MKIDFKWVGAACFILEIDKQFKIACDPSLSPKGTLYDFKFFKSERTIGPEYDASDFKDVDLWLLTHNHLDHLDNDGISVLNQESVKLCHPNVEKKLAEKGLNKTFRANSAGCLDLCEYGASMVIYPQGIFYGKVTPADLDEIIDRTLENDQPVDRLLIREDG